jgi:hypothetical protein
MQSSKSSETPAQIDLEIHELLNQIRANPQMLLPHLEGMVPRFEGTLLKRPGHVNLRTNEGVGAVIETIEYIKNMTPKCQLTWSDDIWRAARDHVLDHGPIGASGHTGSDGSSVSQRIERYCGIIGCSGENIDYGSDTALDVLVDLIIDDGVASRGHRKNIFSPDWKQHACYTGFHKGYKNMTVQDFTGGSYPKGSENPSKVLMDKFLHEDVDFTAADGAPDNGEHRGYSQSTKVQSSGDQVTKTVTRTYNLANGGKKTLTKVVTQTVSY